MQRLDAAIGKLSEALAVLASLILLAMMLIICGDVFTRNVVIPGVSRGLAWSNEISELMLYAITMLAAPWLLREGRHIRVDILLRALPKRVAYASEWLSDIIGFACCLWMLWYGAAAALILSERMQVNQYAGGALVLAALVASSLIGKWKK